MALDRGTGYAVYLLMGTHPDPNNPSKSSFRIAVEAAIQSGMPANAALISIANDKLGLDISQMTGNVDNNLSDTNLTRALNIDYVGAGCPGASDSRQIARLLASHM